MSGTGMFQTFGIEEEADGRYEGFDYDDVDECRNKKPKTNSVDSSPSSSISPGISDSKNELVRRELGDGRKARGTKVAKQSDGICSASQMDRIHDVLDEYERAEKIEEDEMKAQGAKKRLLLRMGGNDTWKSGEKKIKETIHMAKLLVHGYSKILEALNKNDQLVFDSRTDDIASQIILDLLPEGTSVATSQIKIANAVRKIANASTIQGVMPIEPKKSTGDVPSTSAERVRNLVKQMEDLQKSKSPIAEERIVRLLLKCLSVKVTSELLQETQAGKRIRHIGKSSESPSISEATRIVITQWKSMVL